MLPNMHACMHAVCAIYFQVMTPRLGFDLSLRQAHRYTGERMALAGDAAHTVRPQGCACVWLWRSCVNSPVYPLVRFSSLSADQSWCYALIDRFYSAQRLCRRNDHGWDC